MDIQEKLLIRDLRRILHTLPTWVSWRTYGLFVLMFILAFFEVTAIFSMSLMAMSVAAPQTVLAYDIVQWIFKTWPEIKELCTDLRYFTLVTGCFVVVCIAIKNALSAVVGWKSAVLGEDIAFNTGSVIMHNFLYSNYLEHMAGDSASMFQALNWKAMLGQYMVNILNVYTYAISALSLFIVIVSATPSIILSCLFITTLLIMTIYRSMKAAIDRSGALAAKGEQEENSTAMIAMNGIREVLIYRQQPIFLQSYQNICKRGKGARAFLLVAPPIPSWILETCGFLVIPNVIWLLITHDNADLPTIAGVITTIMLVAWRVLPLLNRSIGCLVTLRGLRIMAMECLGRLEAIRKNPPIVPPEPDPSFRFTRDITLSDVCFRYPNAQKDSLSQLNFSIHKGEQLGIVGPSGVGKSTLVALLCGLLPMSGGTLRVDGKELSPEEKAAYIRRIGYVPQAPYILQGTVAENVAFSQWGKPFDEEKVAQACRMAALDLVEHDPRGIRYPIGERGNGLSGGQAQRVSIARALYASPDILILDESTSSLDLGTESAIMNTIATLKGQLTIIIIAHRLTTVEHCDRLIWMDNGQVHRIGTPQEILPDYMKSFEVEEYSGTHHTVKQR